MSPEVMMERDGTTGRISKPGAIARAGSIAGIVLLLLMGLPPVARAIPVPDIVISMGAAADGAPGYAIVVEKSTQTLSIYRFDGALEKTAVYPCSTGKSHGDKWISGDMKTPEGLYFFTGQHRDEELAPVYGTRAFPLNYPNAADRWQGKGGFAIWLHGTDRPLAPNDSNGCVAMNNDDIDRVATVIDLSRTPILVAETLHFVDSMAQEPLRARLSRFVEDWRQRLTTGTYHQYLAAYHPDYLPPIDWWRDWSQFRRHRAGAPEDIDLILDAISFYRHRDMLAAVFQQTLKVGPQRIPAGQRTLFIRDSGGDLSIVGDDYHRIDGGGGQSEVTPLIAAIRRYEQADGAEARVAAFVAKWLKAWASKDLVTYGDCYAESFTSQKMTKDQWLDHKRALNETYARIQVSAHEPSYLVEGDTAVVTFTQRYASNRYRSEGRKTLHLRREKDQWKIFREIYSGT